MLLLLFIRWKAIYFLSMLAVVFLFMGGGQGIKPFITPGDEESFKDLFKDHFLEGGSHAQ